MLLTVLINIIKENIVLFKHSIVKNSKEESSFIKDVSHTIKSINVSDLLLWNTLDTNFFYLFFLILYFFSFEFLFLFLFP